MIAIILSAWLVGDPGVCRDHRVSLAPEISVIQCMKNASAFLAQWSDENPLARGALAVPPGERARHLIWGDRCLPRRRTMILSHWLKAALSAAMFVCVMLGAATAQDMLRFLDLKSDDFTKAEMTRTEIEAALVAADPATLLDLSGRRLNGLDLSGMDLRRTNLRATRLNRANLAGANLGGVTLDQAWALDADLTGASLRGASLFATQLMGAKLDGADLSDARVTGDLSRASMRQARLDRADLSADMRNQSMGLMRGILRSAKLDGASFENANLSRAVLEFASLRDAILKGANLNGSELGGADFLGADVTNADFENADVTSTRLIGLRGRDKARNL
ncbi:MAG: pentapeptide repeat-containing protein, partial [Pseudolabrys sp.]